MRRVAVYAVCLLSLILAGCAVSGSVSTASVTATGDEVTVRSSEWGGTVACGPGLPGEPACAAAPTGQRLSP